MKSVQFANVKRRASSITRSAVTRVACSSGASYFCRITILTET
ncbi:unnamed protein product [Oikopleura dioica]|uniref:Uncharacterized protein n=1 Tax=Oikopleura dioica TaxID=34765 RepID=E4Y0T6_OIKDI|nr:unnamed protein product [Oikopleura dioica]